MRKNKIIKTKINSNNLTMVHIPVRLSIYLVCTSVCMCVTNKRRTDETNRANIFCGNSNDLRKGLWMVKKCKVKSVDCYVLENLRIKREKSTKSLSIRVEIVR